MQNVKGTHDLLPEEAASFESIENLLKKIASLYAYKEVRTPVIESSDLFIRGVGNSSDVVRKEMYTFLDKGDRSLSLRPEFTAGIIRMLVNNKTYATEELPLKYYYVGPVFRYDRPQLGRYRQFNQFGVESVGNDSYFNDVEVIMMAYSMLISLGLTYVKLKINSIGDDTSRSNYRNALKEYFAPHIENMCDDCKQRYELNPLRILDCKVEEDIKIAANAPLVTEYLSKESEERFNNILLLLTQYDIPYEVDPHLVRGLDYYSETVFEFHYQSQNGNNYGAIGGGGHYHKLVKELGGPDLPGIGFSFGVERLYNVLKDDGLLPEDEDKVLIYMMPMGLEARKLALALAGDLRMSGYITDYCFDDCKISAMFKRAEKKEAKYAIIIGDNEVNNNKVIIKDLNKQEQIEVPTDEVVDFFDKLTPNKE
ncbi:MAG: histidine--tRNA ligase [Bacilli bacterium]|nr:histidine--tRNA ligase [Bacilli bacterium]